MATRIVVNRNSVAGDPFRDGKIGREVYVLQATEHLVSGITVVLPHRQTRGHAHPDREEHYYVLSGSGYLQLDNERYPIATGDCIYVPTVSTHTIINPTDEPLEFFWAAFPDEPKLVPATEGAAANTERSDNG